MYIHWAQLGVGGELPKSQDVGLGDNTSSGRRTMLRRANRENCTLLLGARRTDRVGPSVAAVVAREGIDQEVVVMVVVVVAIAVRWIVVVVLVVGAIAWHFQ